MKRFPTGAFETTFGDRRNRTYDGHDFVELSLSPGVEAARPGARLLGRVRYRGYYVFGAPTRPPSARPGRR